MSTYPRWVNVIACGNNGLRKVREIKRRRERCRRGTAWATKLLCAVNQASFLVGCRSNSSQPHSPGVKVSAPLQRRSQQPGQPLPSRVLQEIYIDSNPLAIGKVGLISKETFDHRQDTPKLQEGGEPARGETSTTCAKEKRFRHIPAPQILTEISTPKE